MKVDIIACLRRIWRRIKKEVASMTELNVYIDKDSMNSIPNINYFNVT